MWIDEVRSIAIVGASDTPEKVGGRPLDYLLRYDFDGDIFPINPSKSVIRGLTSYASLKDLPVTPDLVIIAVPAQAVPDVVEQAASIGTGHVIIFSSGFSELGPEGRLAEERIARVAARSATRILGPNCQGVVSPRHGLYATFSSVYSDAPALAGDITILSQSGAVAAMVYSTLREMGRGIRLLCATGNEVDTSVFDLADDLVDTDAPVVALYAEQVTHPRAALSTVRSLIESGKRVVILKAGSTDEGRRAAASHTGSMTSEDAVLLQGFEEAGALLANDVQELAVMAALCEQPVPSDKNVAIISNSGGLGVTLVDQMVALGLSTPPPSDRTKALLADSLPDFIVPGNPADLSTHIMTDPSSIGRLIETLASSGEYQIVLSALGMVSTDYNRSEILDSMARARDSNPTVLVGSVWVGVDPEVVASAGKRGLFSTTSVRLAVETIADIASQSANRLSSVDDQPLSPPVPQPGRSLVAHNEFDSRMLIDSILGTDDPAAFISQRDNLFQTQMQFPVALKVCDDELVHKSDGGFVALGLKDLESVLTQFDRMIAAFEERFTRHPIGFIVEPMAASGFEMFIGVSSHSAVGYSLLVGAGGVDVESIKDTVTLLPPLTDEYVRERLQRLTSWERLTNGRSGPYDTEAFVDLITSFDFNKLSEAGVAEVDINPVIVHKENGGTTVVDSTVLSVDGDLSNKSSLLAFQPSMTRSVR